MQLGVLWLTLLLVGLVAGCAAPAPTPLSASRSSSRPPPQRDFTPTAVAACPPTFRNSVWLPGAQQLLSYCNTLLELKDAKSGQVRGQKLVSTPGGPDDRIQGVVVSPHGERAALRFNAHVEVRELPSLDLSWSVEARTTKLGFSSDGRQLHSDAGAGLSAWASADGRPIASAAPRLAERWQGSLTLNADHTLAFGVEGNKLTLWDPQSDVALRTFEVPKGSRGAPFWVGPFLAFSASDEHWLVDSRDPKRRFSVNGASCLAEAGLSTDETRLRVACDGEVLEWRLGEPWPTVLGAGRPRQVWLGTAGMRVEVSDAAFTVWRPTAAGELVARHTWARPALVELGPAGEVLAVDTLRPRLLLIEAASAAREISLAPSEEPERLAFEPGGGRFVTATRTKLQVYREPSLEVQKAIELPFVPASLGWRAEAPELLVTDARGQLYGVALGDGRATPIEAFPHVERVAVSADGKQVALETLRAGQRLIRLLGAVGTQRSLAIDALQDLRFSPDSKSLWVLEESALLTLPIGAAEPTERKPIKSGHCAARITPEGEVYCRGERLRVLRASGELLPEPEPLSLEPHWSTQGLTLTPTATRLLPVVVTLPAGTLVAERARPPKPEPRPEIPLISGDVRAWTLNADRSVLAVLDGNATVNTFSMRGGLLARLAESGRALIGSEDGSSLAVVAANARGVTVWDTRTWQARFELPVASGISALALTPNGARAAVLDQAGTLQVVLADRSLRRYELRRDMAVRGLALDPSGQYVALGGLPLRIVRLADGAVLYGYAAAVARETRKDTSSPEETIALAWVSETGAVADELRVLGALALPSPNDAGASLTDAAFARKQAPELLTRFFEGAE
jgi:hypothetical protein